MQIEQYKSSEKKLNIQLKNALYDQNLTKILKGYIYKIKLLKRNKPNGFKYLYKYLVDEISTSKGDIKAYLNYALAKELINRPWKYKYKNKKTFNLYNLSSWNNYVFNEHIEAHLLKSLKVDDQLRMSQLSEVLYNARYSKLLRPTLYDFFSHELINFYKQSLSINKKNSKDIYSFYTDYHEFLTLDTKKYKLFSLYKKLLKRNKNNQTVLMHIELSRIRVLKNLFENSRVKYETQLIKVRKRFIKSKLINFVNYEIAYQYYLNKKDKRSNINALNIINFTL